MTIRILDEATRQWLINNSKTAPIVKSYNKKGDPNYNGNRYKRRTFQRVLPSVRSYNEIDMDALFRGDILSFFVPVKGETDDYKVELLFESFKKELQNEVKRNSYKLEWKNVYTALMRCFDKENVNVSCSCPDFKYRFAYWGTKEKWNSGIPQLVAPKFTRTNDLNKWGKGCKHTMCVLSNRTWINKVTSVIYNYIKYAEKTPSFKNMYATYIFPYVYGMPYKKGVQLGLFDKDKLVSTPKDIDDINTAQGRYKR